ncbi:MAG: NAD(P)H-dependent oxidoreductase [Actinomycetota bacterium]
MHAGRTPTDTTSPALTVGVVVGSLRRESVCRKLAAHAIRMAPDSLRLEILEIGDLPLYDEDLDAGPVPLSWQRFRDQVRSVDALLFVTPEYNRSVPAPLKNAVDVGSAPYGANVFAGRPAGIISLSPGRLGAFGANHHLRQSLVFLDVPAMAQPEAYFGDSHEMFDESGQLASAAVEKLLGAYLESFEQWTRRHLRVAAR